MLKYKNCHCGLWNELKVLTAVFFGCAKDEKNSWFSDLFRIFKLKDGAFIAIKRDAVS